jgi:hypothetical protein
MEPASIMNIETKAPGQEPASPSVGMRTRWLLRLCGFVLFTAVVLNPNLKRAAFQVGSVLAPEALIQTNFTALPAIQAELDRIISADQGRHSEARLVAKFVVRKISYLSDYENWNNIEFWPSAEEVWARRQEDCDGRAILATSILRARGYQSARLVVGLDHMWIRVDENEKDPARGPRLIALLSPNPHFNIELENEVRPRDWLRLAKAFLHPTALRETSTHLFAEIPVWRKTLLITALVLLCHYPCRSRTGLLMAIAFGLAAAWLLADWHPEHNQTARGIAGGLFLLLAVSSAWITRSPGSMDRREETLPGPTSLPNVSCSPS